MSDWIMMLMINEFLKCGVYDTYNKKSISAKTYN